MFNGVLKPGNEPPDLPSSVTSKLKQCWTHLFELYPHVPNSPTQIAHIRVSVPVLTPDHRSTLRLSLRWLSREILYPLKPRSIFEQSLRTGDRNTTLFRLAIAHFEERANLRPDINPFPTQTWVDILYGSPLDITSLSCRKRNPLFIKYGYGSQY